jgi:hypothetical protein
MSPDVPGVLPPVAPHYLGLPGAQIVATETLQATQVSLERTLEHRAMMCVYGDAGLGKTLSVRAALRELAAPEQTIRVEFRSRPTTLVVRTELFNALAIGGQPPRKPVDFDRLLREVLAERFRVLVCDESQWMRKECFEYWRYLWDDPNTQIAIVFVGGGDCHRVLQSEPMLASRIYIWQAFRKMSRQQVLTVIPAFHPLWRDVDRALIARVDRQAGHGSFRNWAKITSHCTDALARLAEPSLTPEILAWAVREASGRDG